MTQEEWDIFVAEDLPYEKTCENYPGVNQSTTKKGGK
jgi:hypothetical protein